MSHNPLRLLLNPSFKYTLALSNSSGSSTIQGEVGPAGPQGLQGPMGLQGIPGDITTVPITWHEIVTQGQTNPVPVNNTGYDVYLITYNNKLYYRTVYTPYEFTSDIIYDDSALTNLIAARNTEQPSVFDLTNRLNGNGNDTYTFSEPANIVQGSVFFGLDSLVEFTLYISFLKSSDPARLEILGDDTYFTQYSGTSEDFGNGWSEDSYNSNDKVDGAFFNIMSDSSGQFTFQLMQNCTITALDFERI